MSSGWWLILQVAAVHAAIQPPPWADPDLNPCSSQPGGWLKLYWPQDGQCYRIFQKGAPCPATMELSPGANGAECRCPPGHVQLHEESTCYRIFTRGPCSYGQFLAPLQDDNKGRWGVCTDLQECASAGELFWPEIKQCFQQFSRGPCPNGQLFLLNNSTGLPECGCGDSGPLARFFWPPTKTCHQFYTRGPCLEKGTLYLPGPLCSCHPGLSNFYKPTGQCYELGTAGPCKSGQVYTRSGCVCKPDYVPWPDGHCYRSYTKGPCPQDQLVSLEGACKPLPCPRGKLYFPAEDSCHRVGVQGPCAKGQLVLFEQAVRPAIEGISYKGMCG